MIYISNNASTGYLRDEQHQLCWTRSVLCEDYYQATYGLYQRSSRLLFLNLCCLQLLRQCVTHCLILAILLGEKDFGLGILIVCHRDKAYCVHKSC